MILPSIAFEFRRTGKQLEIFVLAHFLDVIRYPLRLKMPGARPALHTRRRQQGAQKLLRDPGCRQTAAVLGKRRGVECRLVNPRSNEPAEQKIERQPLQQLAFRADRIQKLQDLRACIGAWPAARSEPASPGAPGEAHLPGLSANDRCTPIMIFWPGGDLRTMPALAHNEADMDWR